jgi:hypothetical protein
MRPRLALVLLTLPCVIAFACGGDDTSDGGLDATTDGPPSMDSSGSDSGTDAAGDSGDSGDANVDAANDGGDASDAGDAGDAGLDDAGCGAKTSFAFTSDAGCGVGVDYTCGADQYELECTCSPGICRCKKDDAGLSFITNFAGCPSCSMTPSYSAIALGCGIPY